MSSFCADGTTRPDVTVDYVEWLESPPLDMWPQEFERLMNERLTARRQRDRRVPRRGVVGPARQRFCQDARARAEIAFHVTQPCPKITPGPSLIMTAMKYLLDNKHAPLTFAWGFLDASVDAVVRAYVRWQRTILHSVKVNAVDLSLAEALRHLEPLDMAAQRVLFLSTKGQWTACFDNGAKGGNPSTVVGELSQRMKIRGLACTCIPNTLTRRDGAKPGTWGAVKFAVFAPEKRDFLNVERSVAVTNDVRGWEFHSMGTVQPFEQIDRYAAKRVADRFTAELLEDYCRAFGIDLFDVEFYGGAGVVTHARPWFLPKLATITLTDARRQLGLND